MAFLKRGFFFAFFISTILAFGQNGGKNMQDRVQTATFAGGCFWCVQSDFDGVKGVNRTIVGYTGGNVKNPTYEEVSSGTTGHLEAVEVFYDPEVVSYQELVNFFLHSIDPTRDDGQFCDSGRQYRPVIFYHSEEQKKIAEASLKNIEETSGIKPIKVEILRAQEFYKAEDYHQDYYKKNPLRYKFYRYNCGRDKRLKELWGPSAGH